MSDSQKIKFHCWYKDFILPKQKVTLTSAFFAGFISSSKTTGQDIHMSEKLPRYIKTT